MQFRTLHVDDAQFTDFLWRRYFNLRCELRDKFESSMIFSSYQHLRQHMLDFTQNRSENYHFVVFEGDNPVGWFTLRFSRDENSKVSGNFYCDHKLVSIPSNYARAVAIESAKILQQADCSSIICEAVSPRAINLSKMLGAKELNRFDRYRLYRNRANMAVIQKWLEQYPRQYPDWRVVFFDEVPSQYEKEYIRLFNQFLEDIPEERQGPVPSVTLSVIRGREAVRRKIKLHLYTVALVNSDGEMIGHSNSAINDNDPRSAFQSLTGIDRSFRGKGLSRWLKAEIFVRLGRLYPRNEYINVDMRAINEPILSINRMMGYELFSEGFEYLIELGKLKNIA